MHYAQIVLFKISSFGFAGYSTRIKRPIGIQIIMLKLDFDFDDNIVSYDVSKVVHRGTHHQINKSEDVQECKRIFY